jgi:dihydrofolate synthase/folylpolyglutamate synthase
MKQITYKKINTYEDASAFLEGFINYEKRSRVPYDAARFKLERTQVLLDLLGNPERNLNIIHIAGTKGKGSTATILESCLRHSGYSTGLLTSPHLYDVRERIRLDSHPVSRRTFCSIADRLRNILSAEWENAFATLPTYFELLTAMALEAFQRHNADWSIIEVGMGGRLDSTNVVSPACCVITPVEFDHTHILGSTIEKIAREKAGIIKPGVPVILSKQPYSEARKVILNRAAELNCELWETGKDVKITGSEPLTIPKNETRGSAGWDFEIKTPLTHHTSLHINLLGEHQLENCAAAVGALDMLGNRGLLPQPAAIRDGMEKCTIEARMELVQTTPPLIIDTAHTARSIRALVNAVRTHFPGRKLTVVFGCASDKNWKEMLGILKKASHHLVTTMSSATPRAADCHMLAEYAREIEIPQVEEIKSPVEATRQALRSAGGDEVVCVTGSFYVAGEVRVASAHKCAKAPKNKSGGDKENIERVN